MYFLRIQETKNPYISTMNYRHPFHNAPDPYLFFPSKEHQAALNLLLKFLRAKKGLFLLMGKIGTGKTTLCRYIQANYAQEFAIGLIGNPFLTPKQFEQKVLQEFNLTASSNNDFLTLLHNKLLKLHNNKKNPVLFLDEGHLLGPELFEFILILSNLQADNVHLLQIVIAGQPELENTLRQPRFASLYQRIGGRIFLSGLSAKDTRNYIQYRLTKSGLADKIQISFRASRKIWLWTRGIPRQVNKVCDLCLDYLYSHKQQKITPSTLKKAVLQNKHSTFYPPTPTIKIYLFAFFILGFISLASPKQISKLTLYGFREQFTLNTIASTFDNSSFKSKLHTTQRQNLADQDDSNSTQNQLVIALNSLRQEIKRLNTVYTNQTKTEIKHENNMPPGPETQDNNISQTQNLICQTRVATDLNLSAIVWDIEPEQRCAVINEKILRQGEEVSGYKLISIEKNYVRLVKDDLTYTLKIKSDLK